MELAPCRRPCGRLPGFTGPFPPPLLIRYFCYSSYYNIIFAINQYYFSTIYVKKQKYSFLSHNTTDRLSNYTRKSICYKSNVPLSSRRRHIKAYYRLYFSTLCTLLFLSCVPLRIGESGLYIKKVIRTHIIPLTNVKGKLTIKSASQRLSIDGIIA